MSSLIRRIQKKIAKGQGYYRNKSDGLIYDKDGNLSGPHWPKVAYPTKKKEAN